MIRVFLLSLFLIPHSFAEELDMNQHAQEIYQKTGLTSGQVPFDHFKSAYFRYLQGRIQDRGGKAEFNKPLITFINFNIHNGTKRLFVTDVSSSGASLVFESYVGHGVNSDDGGNSVRFGNVPESKKSSLGFFRTSENYQGKYGYSLRVDGRSPGVNDNARSRAIVWHASYYSTLKVIARQGRMGNSWGCFTVPYSYRDSLFDAIRGGTLLYAFHDSLPPKESSGQGLSDVAQMDTDPSGVSVSQGEELPSLNDDPDYSTAEPSMESLGQAGMNECPMPGQGVDGPGTLAPIPEDVPENFDEENPQVTMNPNAPLHGSDDFVRCQGYASKPYDKLVDSTQAGANTGAHFKSSFRDTENKSGSCDNIYPEAQKNYYSDHYGRVRECVALSGSINPRVFTDLDDPNEHITTASDDGKISCDYKGVTTADDYFSCVDNLLTPHNNYLRENKETHAIEAENTKDVGTEINENLKSAGYDLQATSAISVAGLNKSVSQSAKNIENLQKAHIESLAAGLAAMPTHASLLGKCRSHYSRQPDSNIADFQVLSKTVIDIKTHVPKIQDPCIGVLNRMGNKFLVNKKAKNQAIAVIKELGGKVEDLQEIQAQLGKRNKALGGIGSSGRSSGSFTNRELATYRKIDGDEASDRIDKELGDVSANSNSSQFNRSPSSINSMNFRKSSNQIYNEKNFNNNNYLSQLQQNSHAFFHKAKKETPDNILTFMRSHGLTLEDIEFAYKAGKISKKRRDFLMKKLRGRVGVPTVARKVSFPTLSNSKAAKTEFDIEKNKDKSLFEIISHRYFKKIPAFTTD